MVFNFFGLKKKPVIEDVEVKVPAPEAQPLPMTFDEALAAQEEAEAAAKGQAAIAELEVTAPVADADVAAEATLAREPEVLGQMDTMKATREDVIAAYKIFLGRVPESMEVVDHRVGQPVAAVLMDFLASKEFLDQVPKSQLVLAVAKKILDERKQATAAEGAEPFEQGQSAA